MIIKNHNKITLNVTHIIDRHIQMHSQDFYIYIYIYINSNSHLQNN